MGSGSGTKEVVNAVLLRTSIDPRKEMVLISVVLSVERIFISEKC